MAKKKVCDSCGEEWEEDFFCPTCSSGGEFRIVLVPNIMWDGHPGHEYEEQEEWFPAGDVCLNCCMGHTKPNPVLQSDKSCQSVSLGYIDDEDIPF